MVVFCSLFPSNTLNQLARTAHNNPVADICFGHERGLTLGIPIPIPDVIKEADKNFGLQAAIIKSAFIDWTQPF